MVTCHCGQPLHYTNPVIQAMVERLIDEKGRYVDITVIDGKTYSVDRHFIALHGITAAELPKLGFKEVV